MSWKYVLVGLALIFPGNLLFVDGRESKEFGDTSADDGSVLKSLLDYFRNRRVDHDPSDVSSEDNSKDASEDFNHQVADIENNEKIIGPDNSQNSQFPASDRHDSSDERGTPKMKMKEVTGEVQQPLALAIRQQEHRGSTTKESVTNGMSFILIVTGCTVLAAIGVVGAGVCWYKYNKRAKSASVVDYPAYGVTGPTKDRLPSPGDRKLAQSAQMYHYQHQKQQMIAMEKANGSMKHDASDEESEEENVEGDYTVYECPGLAPTGEMEVKNPLFRGDETPSTPVNEEPPQPEDK